MFVHVAFAHLDQRGRRPARPVVFVDQARPYALTKIRVLGELHGDSKLECEGFLKRQAHGTPVDFENDFGGCRRSRTKCLYGTIQPRIGLGPSGECFQYLFDTVVIRRFDLGAECGRHWLRSSCERT